MPGGVLGYSGSLDFSAEDVLRSLKKLDALEPDVVLGGDAPDGRRVKATLHWVSAEHAIEAEVRARVAAGPGAPAAPNSIPTPRGCTHRRSRSPCGWSIATSRPFWTPCGRTSRA